MVCRDNMTGTLKYGPWTAFRVSREPKCTHRFPAVLIGLRAPVKIAKFTALVMASRRHRLRLSKLAETWPLRQATDCRVPGRLVCLLAEQTRSWSLLPLHGLFVAAEPGCYGPSTQQEDQGRKSLLLALHDREYKARVCSCHPPAVAQ